MFLIIWSSQEGILDPFAFESPVEWIYQIISRCLKWQRNYYWLTNILTYLNNVLDNWLDILIFTVTLQELAPDFVNEKLQLWQDQ